MTIRYVKVFDRLIFLSVATPIHNFPECLLKICCHLATEDSVDFFYICCLVCHHFVAAHSPKEAGEEGEEIYKFWTGE